MFLATDPKQIWGWQGEERPRFATPERVILDVLSSTRYGVSFSQMLSALSLAVQRDPEFLVPWLRACAASNRMPPRDVSDCWLIGSSDQTRPRRFAS